MAAEPLYLLYIFLIPYFGLGINVVVHSIINHLSKGAFHLGPVIISFVFGAIVTGGISLYVSREFTSMNQMGLTMLNSLTYCALGYCYFTFVNLVKTSLRLRILRELVEYQNGIDRKKLNKIYNAQEIYKMRISRLIQWGQIQDQEGRYKINKRGFLFLSLIISWLKKVLIK